MEDSLRKNKPKDHVSPKRQSSANAPSTHDLQRDEGTALSAGDKPQRVASPLREMLPSFWMAAFKKIKIKNKSPSLAILLLDKLHHAQSKNADTKFWNKCAFTIWHRVKKYFLGLPLSCRLQRLQTQQDFFLFLFFLFFILGIFQESRKEIR